MPTIEELGPQLTKLLTELDKRSKQFKENHLYIDGSCPIPPAIEAAKLKTAYRTLMALAEAPWANTVVDSVQDRLEVSGIRTGDPATDKELWMVWQANALDAESKLGHNSALTDGRVFATIWPDTDGVPEIVYDGADQVVVQYPEGRHQPRHRVAALRRWVDSDDQTQRVTLYTRDALYKLKEAKEQTATSNGSRVKGGGTWWEQREEMGRDGDPEPWPLPNPYRVIPVVEIATNRQLKAGPFPYARGEYQHCTGLIDRINLLTFLGLVVAVWMGFPLRYMLGGEITRDDDGNEIPPFESKPDSIVQDEDPNVKIGQLQAADRKNLSVFPELSQLAYVTKTPAHYFPMDGGLSNISADAIRALEGGLHAKVNGIHKPFLGEGHEEVLRVAGLMMETSIEVPTTAEVVWLPKETRSLAEMADAATKLKDLMPFTFIAEEYLGWTQEMIRRAESSQAQAMLANLMAAAETPSESVVAAAANGAGG